MKELRGNLKETKGILKETRGKLKEAKGKLKETRGKLQETRGKWKETRGTFLETKIIFQFSGKLQSQKASVSLLNSLSKKCKKQSRKGGTPQGPKIQPTLHNNLIVCPTQ